VSVESIYNWFHLWQEQGLCGVLTLHGGGRPRALSKAMPATAMEVASTKSITLGQIAKRIEAVNTSRRIWF
jgi:transposase